ncbi:MAG TPA: hypothetical protein VHW23_05920 [Kofleriaceae bacterium]|jgi:predicted regulator of Ras-like GTPase activity (Roadblock/LC7/MglB family)|nr:hypothetical protein [Kofleriaceae bacterium]
MLEPILQTLREVGGVQGAMVVDASAALIAHHAHTIYDRSVLQQVARSIVNSVDSAQLIQDDWDVMTVHFGDGKLLLRSLRTSGAKPRRYVLAVIADTTLNVAFLGVALRVAATKLIAELESGPPVASTSSAVPTPMATGTSGRVSAESTKTEIAKTGLSWSGTTAGSGASGSDVEVTDPGSSTFLSACTKALAASVGPMAKVFVKEAVRKVCGDRPFSRADVPALVAHLSTSIDDLDDRTAFQRKMRGM